MATNLRLRPDAESALRAAAAKSGRSQQELIREAIDRYLVTEEAAAPGPTSDSSSAGAIVRAPRMPLTRAPQRIRLPNGQTSADLLERDDRL